jgi:hypothetical protein
MAPPRIDTRQELKDAGWRSATEAVKLARQARMRELFEAEAIGFQEELEGMGYSLVKPRD